MIRLVHAHPRERNVSRVRRIRRGMAGHPGTGFLLLFVVMGAVVAGVPGAAVMLAVYGPLYLWGAYERGKVEERHGDQQEHP